MCIFSHRPMSTQSSSHPLCCRQLPMDTSLSHRILQVVLIVALFSSTNALIGSDEEQAVKFNSQLRMRDNQSAQQLKSRLATLLDLKKSIAQLMKERKEYSPATDDNDTEEDELVTEKRVFCNGFTGCGGRFRGYRSHHNQFLEDMRKRVLKAAASKRPFCNNNGCFNGGKRKNDEDIANSVAPGSTFSLQEEDEQPISTPKRLFCNGYGGCRNMGKRGLLPALMVEKQTPESQSPPEERKPMLEILLQPNKDKRFFASSYDATMDDFLDDLS